MDDLATFLSQGPRASSSWAQVEKLNQSSILLEDWAIHRMSWHGRLFERGSWNGKKDQLVKVKILNTHNSPAEAMDGDGMWEEKACQAYEEEERRKIRRWWVDR